MTATTQQQDSDLDGDNAGDIFTTEAALRELDAITEWWLAHAIDREHGGFHGEIDASGRPAPGARKSLVQNARLLWFFSEVARTGGDARCRMAADRAYHFFLDRFDDPGFGGAFWSVEADGRVADGGKRVYGLCFAIYALCAFYRLSSDTSAITKARDYLAVIRERARDPQHGGYLECFNRDWSEAADMRLDPADIAAPKSMNTHLHLVEACTALHRAAPNGASKRALREAIDLFFDHIFKADSARLAQYFERDWSEIEAPSSFGHEIEASWLLWESAEVLGDPVVLTAARPRVMALAERVLARGVAPEGFVVDIFSGAEYSDNASAESTWWVQAEAVVGFLNADIISGDHRWREAADRVWAHIRSHHMNPGVGEWRWAGKAGCDHGGDHYLAGAWKGPYHNGRAMMESARRLSALEAS